MILLGLSLSCFFSNYTFKTTMFEKTLRHISEYEISKIFSQDHIPYQFVKNMCVFPGFLLFPTKKTGRKANIFHHQGIEDTKNIFQDSLDVTFFLKVMRVTGLLAYF